MSASASASASAAIVTVSIRMLSGDLLSLEVPTYMTRQAFYGRVYQQMPDEVAPEEDYMITLFRQGEELPADGEALQPKEEDEFCLFVDTRAFEVELSGAWWDTFDMTRPMNQMFRHWEYTVTQVENGVHSIFKKENFYYNEDEVAWFVKDRVQSEIVGRRGDEEVIQIPDDETAYLSIERIAEVMVERFPNLTRRAQTHIKERLVWLWNDMNSPYPYQENLPEEPLGIQRNEWRE